MPVQSIYLLVGSTGEYSDHTEWVVAAYTTQEQADYHMIRLVEEFRGSEGWDYEKRQDYKTVLDPKPYIMLCTGAEYRVDRVPLVRHFDEFLEEIGENAE